MFLAPPEMQPDRNLEPVEDWVITAEQAGDILGCSPDAVRKIAAGGYIQTYRVSPTETRYWLSDVATLADRVDAVQAMAAAADRASE